MEIIGLDHVYFTVSDFGQSEAFYDRAMRALGFRKGDRAIAGEPHAHYFNPALQVSIRPARSAAPAHDPYAPGLHHFCFQVRSRADVDEAHSLLLGEGVDATAPKLYPDYNPDYYATFFSDPDGLRLEVLCRTPARDLIAERWNELPDVVNPVAALLERDSRIR